MEELQLPIQVPTLVQYKQSHQQGPQQARVKDMREHQLFQQVAGNRLISAAKSLQNLKQEVEHQLGLP
jgi:hypothetical protein